MEWLKKKTKHRNLIWSLHVFLERRGDVPKIETIWSVMTQEVIFNQNYSTGGFRNIPKNFGGTRHQNISCHINVFPKTLRFWDIGCWNLWKKRFINNIYLHSLLLTGIVWIHCKWIRGCAYMASCFCMKIYIWIYEKNELHGVLFGSYSFSFFIYQILRRFEATLLFRGQLMCNTRFDWQDSRYTRVV